MKKTILLLIAAVPAFVLPSCQSLDVYPADQMASAEFFRNEAHAKDAMMGVYSMMQNDHVFGLQFSMDVLGGICMGYDSQSYQPIARGTYDVTNTWVENKWKNIYEGVARANVVLQNLDRCNMSDSLKIQYRGEARFMRALYYFALLDYFGGVPIYDETTVVRDEYAKMLKPRSSAEEVRSFILRDLSYAEASLPEEWDQSNYGRATRYAATALKGKVYLFAHRYAEASGCFSEIISSGRFELYKDYAALFKPGGDSSSEMIFAIQNMGGVGTDHGMKLAFYLGTRETFGSCWNNVMGADALVNSYEYLDGRPFSWEDWFPGFNTNTSVKNSTFLATVRNGNTLVSYPASRPRLLEMYSQRDPRMTQTFIMPYTSYKGWNSNAEEDCEYIVASGISSGYNMIRVNNNYMAYLFRKFVPEGNMNGAINNRAHTPINFPLIRYADVLLMQAECLNELDDLDGAAALVNQVRARSGMPGINSGSAYLRATTKSDMFNRIRHERAVELAGEGHSFADMKRWGLLETLDGVRECQITGTYIFTRSVDSRDYLWPIPATEIEKNPLLKQNPDW